jgi:NAD(P)-dependent dehydrogenase (short-subunit alcohol dehydrogenase family)
MTIADKTVLVTGANRGIGQALVEEALARGAKRVYAGTRQPLARPDGRVTPLTLDVTDTAQIRAAADQVESLDVLINAGIALFDDLSDSAVLERHLGRQPLRPGWRHPGLPAVADSFSGSLLAAHSCLRDLEGGGST